MKFRIEKGVPAPGDNVVWEDTDVVFEEKPAPERTLGSVLLEARFLTGLEHRAVPLDDEDA